MTTKAKKARLDADRSGKPMTRLVARVDGSRRINPATPATAIVHEDGTRMNLHAEPCAEVSK